jgi:uncharacterized protein YraI
MKVRLALLASSILLASPLLALARDAFTVDDVSLQAGPDEEYPSITQLPAGTEVSLQGCIDGWTWCDVVAGGDRGWVPASYLEEEYNNQRVLVVDYGPRIGIPVVSFSVGAYWDRHYHNRPWYHERERWESRHIQPRAMPRPTQASRGGADFRAHAEISSGDQHRGNDNYRRDDHARTQHADAARTQQSTVTQQHDDAARTQQSAATQQHADAQMSARASQNTSPAQQQPAQPQTAAQGDLHTQQNATPQDRDNALGAGHRVPPQVQTARNNTPPSASSPQDQQHGHTRARDERQHDQGEHKGDAKDHDAKKDRDHDRDGDHE